MSSVARRIPPAAFRMLAVAVVFTGVFTAARVDAGGSRALSIVVHPSNALARMSAYDIRKAFSGEMSQWPGGFRMQVIEFTENAPEYVAFHRAVFGKNGGLRPRGSPILFSPITQGEAASVQRLVSIMPNAVAYVWDTDVSDGVKVIATVSAAN